MATAKREFIPNQVFVGLPWKNVRAKYDRIVPKLEAKYPLHFTIVGRNDGQDAEDLLAIIKQRISSSSHAVFDATGGNANVSLEYGYAEGREVPRSIYISAHKASSKMLASGAIISDLSGKRRVQYTTESGLSKELHKLCRDHPYTVRFEKFLKGAGKGLTKGAKQRARSLAIKTIRALDGKDKVRRADLIQHVQARGYKESEADWVLKQLHSAGVLKCTVGKYSEAYIA